MIKNYFKQAWQLLKENKLYSTIYIFGTALAICMVMVIFISFDVQVGNIPPEVNRSKSLYALSANITPKDTTDESSFRASWSVQSVMRLFYPLKSAEAVTAIPYIYDEDVVLSREGGHEYLPVITKYTDEGFWKVFNFTFLEGEAYQQSDLLSGVKKIVLDYSTARKLFGGESALGKSVIISNQTYRVCGVVQNSSYMLEDSFANVWMPYTTYEGYDESWDDGGILGQYMVIITASSASKLKDVKAEILERKEEYEGGLDYHIDLSLASGRIDAIFMGSSESHNKAKVLGGILLLIALFTMVPVLNLSGLNSSRLEKRSPEIGVRKAFGGTHRQLEVQIIIENILLTFIGGIIGYIFSSIVVHIYSSEMMANAATLSVSDITVLKDNRGLTGGMMLNMRVFVIALLSVFVVNLLSTIVPARRYARKNIVDALFENRN